MVKKIKHKPVIRKGEYDADGKEHGVWAYNYANVDLIASKFTYVHGIKHGPYEIYSPTPDNTKSLLTHTGYYVNDKENGLKKYYYNNGNVYFQGIIFNERYHGLMTTFSHENDKIIELDFYL